MIRQEGRPCTPVSCQFAETDSSKHLSEAWDTGVQRRPLKGSLRVLSMTNVRGLDTVTKQSIQKESFKGFI